MFSRIDLAPGSGSPHDNGRLEVHEVLGLRIPASLVFLSGCETGLGPSWSTAFNRGDDYASLAQAFLFAGAENVISTLWPIDDAGGAEFAERFYARLESRGPAEALALAQRQSIEDPRTAHPFHWAAYQASGITAVVTPNNRASPSVQRH